MAKKDISEKLKSLNKKYGEGIVIVGNTVQDYEVISTGSITLDKELGIGGIPKGKLIEIMGMESTGKSTSVLHIIANFQKAGLTVGYGDSEHSFDKAYATKLGVDVDNLLIISTNCMEEAYNTSLELARDGYLDLLVWDSQTALLPRKVLEGEVGQATIGLAPRINSETMPKFKEVCHKHNCTVIFISQLRSNIGGYGDINVPTGGNALKFYADIRLQYTKSVDKDGEQNKTTVTVKKNKCAPPFGVAKFNIVWGEGIDTVTEYTDYAESFGLITKAGSWYNYKDNKIQGGENLRQFFIDNESMYQELQKEVKERLKL